MPVKTGIQVVGSGLGLAEWIPACAGMTELRMCIHLTVSYIVRGILAMGREQ